MSSRGWMWRQWLSVLVRVLLQRYIPALIDATPLIVLTLHQKSTFFYTAAFISTTTIMRNVGRMFDRNIILVGIRASFDEPSRWRQRQQTQSSRKAQLTNEQVWSGMKQHDDDDRMTLQKHKIWDGLHHSDGRSESSEESIFPLAVAAFICVIRAETWRAEGVRMMTAAFHNEPSVDNGRTSEALGERRGYCWRIMYLWIR